MKSAYFCPGGISTKSYKHTDRKREDSTWTCFYCGSTNRGDECLHCNAPRKEKTLSSLWGVNPSGNFIVTYRKPAFRRFVDALKNTINNIVEFISF